MLNNNNGGAADEAKLGDNVNSAEATTTTASETGMTDAMDDDEVIQQLIQAAKQT